MTLTSSTSQDHLSADWRLHKYASYMSLCHFLSEGISAYWISIYCIYTINMYIFFIDMAILNVFWQQIWLALMIVLIRGEGGDHFWWKAVTLSVHSFLKRSWTHWQWCSWTQVTSLYIFYIHIHLYVIYICLINDVSGFKAIIFQLVRPCTWTGLEF